MRFQVIFKLGVSMPNEETLQRREQLFELLRQQNMTDIALARAKLYPQVRVESDDVNILKSVAAQSFRTNENGTKQG